MRVQIPAYTDRWMRGDRFGRVIGHNETRKGGYAKGELVKVRLEISGKTMWFIADDCTPA